MTSQRLETDRRDAAPGADSPPFWLQAAIAVAAPVAVAALQWLVWDLVQPFVWFLFYPTVFFCAWIGGRRTAQIATAVSVILVIYFFVPPQLSWMIERPQTWFSIVIFTIMGVLFGEAQEGRRRAHARMLEAMAQAASAAKALEMRQAELAASEEKLRLILESSGDGMIGVDEQGCVTFANPAAERMLGFPKGGLIGKDLHATIHHSHADGTPYPHEQCPILDVARGQDTVRIDGDTFWRMDGTSMKVSSVAHPMLRDGKAVGLVIAFSDSTLRHQAELAREQARSEAERLAQIKAEFLANMSHEIRTPLNGVLGLAQVGQRQSAPHPELQDLFRRIVESGQLLLHVINDILDFSKIEAGKLSVECVPMQLSRVVQEATESLRPQALAKGLELRVTGTDRLPATCAGDPNRISQILLNLLSNAVKFTERGRILVDVHHTADQFVVSVEDTGIGMNEEQLRRLFSAFEQADGSTTRRFGGTGLGLSITKRLVDLLGGEIRVQSSPGQGSRFELRLPCQATTSPNPIDMPWTAHPSAKRGTRLSGLRLLVAEDNEIGRMVIEQMLLLEDADVTLVENGRQAVEAVSRDPTGWDAVLMDVHMPEMDGLEATRRIRGLAPTVPVIGQTASALSEERDSCRMAGMVDQVTKPIEAEALVEAVLRHARRRHGAVISTTRDAGASEIRGSASSKVD